METMNQELAVLLADTYALYLKTQNYHWHVKGPQFKSLHQLFEDQYQSLALAVDEIAERLLILGYKAPATFREYVNLTRIKEGDSNLKANEMVKQLAQDHQTLVKDLQRSIKVAQEQGDEGTVTLLGERMAEHEKARWMLHSSQEL